MNFRLIFIFGLSIEFVSPVDFECVQRRSGACRAFTISQDFDHFFVLDEYDFGDLKRISTIIEIDYIENKYSYNLDKNTLKKEFDTVDNPVVELLFSKNRNPKFSYRLGNYVNSNQLLPIVKKFFAKVLGEKLNRLAYVEVVDINRTTKYNNYSPDLPAWPFAINVTVDRTKEYDNTLNVYTKNGDGFDKEIPFLSAGSSLIVVHYISFRSRNENVKLVGFYDCSTKYGSNCGEEMTQTITDCREKISPLGSGFFKTFVDMSKFDRSGEKGTHKKLLHYDEVFGIYRRNNDNMHILFTTEDSEAATYIRLSTMKVDIQHTGKPLINAFIPTAIGDEVKIRLKSVNALTFEYYEKTAIRKSWNQEPSEPNFIRVVINSASKQISIYRLDDNKPILTMNLCNYFHYETIQFMSVTSNHFNTVDLYYDCCLPEREQNCHVYERKDDSSIDGGNNSDDPNAKFIEVETLKGDNKTKTFLDTRDFRETNSTLYIYGNGTSLIDYCP